jgi:hypothetical protein
VGDRFRQFDRPVHGVDVSNLHLDFAHLVAVWTTRAFEFFDSHFASPFPLNGPAQSLASIVSGELNVVEVRHPIALLASLKFGGNGGCLL